MALMTDEPTDPRPDTWPVPRSDTSFMPDTSVHGALDAVCSLHADRPALTYIHSADPDAPCSHWTYREFINQVRRAARLFTQLAGTELPRVALLLPPVPQAHFALWGAEAAGVVCPINFLLKAEHIAELVQAAGANILVALGPHADLDIASRAQQVQAACPQLRHVLWADDDAQSSAQPSTAAQNTAVTNANSQSFSRLLAQTPDGPWPRPLMAPPGEVVALFHTGGTTGAPKLAQHTHTNQLHAARGAAQSFAMTERDVLINGFPLFHVAGAFVYGLSTLLSGACLVLPTVLGMRNADFVKRYWLHVERHQVSLLAAVPTVMASLLTVDRGGASSQSVRALLTGGSPLPNELALQFERTHGIPVRNILGMTECAGVISVEPFDQPRTPGSCGLPLPFTSVVAVAADGSLCGAQQTGVLRVRGPNVGPGYTDPARNAGTFTADGWLITGDIGHVDAEGRVFVTGRAKDLIIRSGHNIDPGVIEAMLLAHPAVQMAAAVGEPDEYAGELPVAYVVLKPAATAHTTTVQSLLQFCAEHIAERPACPKRIEILDSLPTTAVGKVYKPSLRLRAIEQALTQRLLAAKLAPRVTVQGVDEGGQLAVKFCVPTAASSADDEARIRQIMAPFALPFSIQLIHPADHPARSGPRS
jgi:fatty-acyl-CoA synthase